MTKRDLGELARLRVLPPRVAWFQWRARRRARALGDSFTLDSSTRPRDLAQLLRLARGRRRIVELGTANGWTAIALALSDRERTVQTFDPFDRPERCEYLALVRSDVKRRIEFVQQPGTAGAPARDQEGQPRFVDLLYIDSSHEREETVAEVLAWRGSLRAGGLIVFDDYDHPEYPGVRAAIEGLGLPGQRLGTLFVHEVDSAQ